MVKLERQIEGLIGQEHSNSGTSIHECAACDKCLPNESHVFTIRDFRCHIHTESISAEMNRLLRPTVCVSDVRYQMSAVMFSPFQVHLMEKHVLADRSPPFVPAGSIIT